MVFFSSYLIFEFFSLSHISLLFYNRYILGANILGLPVYLLYGMTGIVMYAHYYGCDPLRTGRVKRPEQV